MISSSILKSAESIRSITGPFDGKVLFVSTDSRKYSKGGIFIALSGPSFDGAKYLESVIGKGCQVVVFDENDENSKMAQKLMERFKEVTFIAVTDSLKYLQEVAHLHLLKWVSNKSGRRIIGITGSNGKTTTKEMLFDLLNNVAPDKVHYTQGNFNNHIGVPLTLLGLRQNHDFLIVELGSNHPGEIMALCEIAMPDTGIITNIGSAHLEFFKTEENIFLEKKSLYDFVSARDGYKCDFVINGDDKYLSALADSGNLVAFGETGSVKTEFIDDGIKIIQDDLEISLRNKEITGEHNFINLVASFLMARNLFSGKVDNLIDAAEKFRPQSNRSVWVDEGNSRFFLDAYNANPSSMRASLDSFIGHCQKNEIPMEDICFILGDMNELGDFAESAHWEIGHLLCQRGAISVIFVGNYCRWYGKGFGNKAKIFDSRTQLSESWSDIKQNHRYFFLKGSRTLRLELLLSVVE